MNRGSGPSQDGFGKGSCCLTSLISFYGRVTHLGDEEKAVDIVYPDFVKLLTAFPTAFSQRSWELIAWTDELFTV